MKKERGIDKLQRLTSNQAEGKDSSHGRDHEDTAHGHSVLLRLEAKALSSDSGLETGISLLHREKKINFPFPT